MFPSSLIWRRKWVWNERRPSCFSGLWSLLDDSLCSCCICLWCLWEPWAANSLGGAKSIYYVRICGFSYTLKIKMITQRGQFVIFWTSWPDQGPVNAMAFLSLDEPRMTSRTCSTCWFLDPVLGCKARFSKGGAWESAFIKSFPVDPMLSKYKSWSSS